MTKGMIVGLIITAIAFVLSGWVVTLIVDDIQTANTVQQHCEEDGGVYIVSRDFDPYCIKKDATIDLRS